MVRASVMRTLVPWRGLARFAFLELSACVLATSCGDEEVFDVGKGFGVDDCGDWLEGYPLD